MAWHSASFGFSSLSCVNENFVWESVFLLGNCFQHLLYWTRGRAALRKWEYRFWIGTAVVNGAQYLFFNISDRNSHEMLMTVIKVNKWKVCSTPTTLQLCRLLCMCVPQQCFHIGDFLGHYGVVYFVHYTLRLMFKSILTIESLFKHSV